jgi:phosphoribosylformylglycinamidine cyclo-ligase
LKTYEQAGVNIAAGDELVHRIKQKVRSTFSPAVLSDIGSFGAFFDGKFKGTRSPVLVSSTDGVGTKLRVAFLMNKHDTVGQDLVNHCVNDIAVCGARPLFFLDYIGMGKLNPLVAEQIITGMVKGCKENSCSLVGGETAEMPGFYRENEYDLVGTIVGVVDRKNMFDGTKVKKGDILLGLPSKGLHTNGYSLARSVLFEQFEVDDFVDELGARLGDVLLVGHRSYLKAIQSVKDLPAAHAFAHITGGGIAGNTSRVIPKPLHVHIDWQSWERPPVFRLIQKLGEVPEDDMRRTFNLGVGLVIVAAKRGADKLLNILRKQAEHPVILGEVKK